MWVTQLAQDIEAVTLNSFTPEQVAARFIAIAVEQWHNTPVYRRENLQPGDSISGLAI